jgi:hypothetical protein
MPSAEVGADVRKKRALNCWPWVRSLTPFARGRDPFTGSNGCGVPHYGHDIPMPAHLGAQNAEAILGIVVGDALDKARQNFPVRRFRLRPHVGIISAHLMAK